MVSIVVQNFVEIDVCEPKTAVTVIPPTQEDAVLGSRKNTVRVRNIAQSQLTLLYSTFHKVIQHLIVSRTYTVTVRHQQTLTNPDRL